MSYIDPKGESRLDIVAGRRFCLAGEAMTDDHLNPKPGAEFIIRSDDVIHAVRVAARTDNHVTFHVRAGGTLLSRMETVSLDVWRRVMRTALLICDGHDTMTRE